MECAVCYETTCQYEVVKRNSLHDPTTDSSLTQLEVFSLYQHSCDDKAFLTVKNKSELGKVSSVTYNTIQ